MTQAIELPLDRLDAALTPGLPVELDNMLVGGSQEIARVREQVRRLGATPSNALVVGETGCGKEVVARLLHQLSGRSGPFVAINCAALPETLFESEFFGHEAGAFTGAAKRRIGKLEYAAGGTLFLDEIEALPLSLQAKLLRALQERHIERLGSNQSINTNFRLICASNKELVPACTSGVFRADLYYRISVAIVRIPPLRERLGDIAPLTSHFANKLASHHGIPAPNIDSSVLLRFMTYDWPGNVRELMNAVERILLGLDPLPGQAMLRCGGSSLSESLACVERALLENVLRASSGIGECCVRLGISPATLYRKLRRYQLSAPVEYSIDSELQPSRI